MFTRDPAPIAPCSPLCLESTKQKRTRTEQTPRSQRPRIATGSNAARNRQLSSLVVVQADAALRSLLTHPFTPKALKNLEGDHITDHETIIHSHCKKPRVGREAARPRVLVRVAEFHATLPKRISSLRHYTASPLLNSLDPSLHKSLGTTIAPWISPTLSSRIWPQLITNQMGPHTFHTMHIFPL